MHLVADLHIHSKYSRAVSPKMNVEEITRWSEKKGIDIVASSDWTHPVWLAELKSILEPAADGLFKAKNLKTKKPVYFILSTEISCIYNQAGATRRIHIVVLAPSFAAVDKINNKLLARGAKLASDGRPILGLSAYDLTALILDSDPNCFIIPAHIWTPWFSLYGSKSGFDSINECFGNYAKYIYAIETGLSSDPAMNWQIKELDSRAIISSSDAHSGPKLAREVTVFDIPNNLSYNTILAAIKNSNPVNFVPEKGKITYTVEFYPEEGKYHYTGHRNCHIVQSPDQTAKKGKVCSVCGRPLTVGVMHRVNDLTTRKSQEINIENIKIGDVKAEKFNNRPPFIKLVPLLEIIAESLNIGPATKGVYNEYDKLINNLGSELEILINTKIEDIKAITLPKIAEAITRVRRADICIDPGFDGQFGVVKIWGEGKKEGESASAQDQMTLF